MIHREDIWGRTQALIGRPFIYANGSLFYGEPGKHHHEILEQHPEINDLWQYPGTLAAGRVWPEQNNYWTPTGDNEEVRQALENEFSKEHSGSLLKESAVLYKFVWLDGDLHVGPPRDSIVGDPHHYDMLMDAGYAPKSYTGTPRDFEDTDNDIVLGVYSPPNLHIYQRLGNTPNDQVLLQEIQNQIGSHLGASNYNVQKYVWFDGKMIVTPPQYMHDEPYHATLAQDLGYKWDDPSAAIEMGYYYPDDDSLQPYQEKGQGLPSEPELKEFLRAHPNGNLEGYNGSHLKESDYVAPDLYKFVWGDGKLAVSGPQKLDTFPHHPDLFRQLGYLDYYNNPSGDGTIPDAVVAGYYYPDGAKLSILYDEGEVPSPDQLKAMIEAKISGSPKEHQAAALFPFHKYVWADGNIAVGPQVQKDSEHPWHTHLMQNLGYNYHDHMPEEWSVGYYYPHDHSTYELDGTENVPRDYDMVKEVHNHLYGDHTSSYFLETQHVSEKCKSSVHAGRGYGAVANPWIRLKDGRYFEGMHGQSSHMQIMYENNINPEDVAEYGGGEMSDFWNKRITTVDTM